MPALPPAEARAIHLEAEGRHAEAALAYFDLGRYNRAKTMLDLHGATLIAEWCRAAFLESQGQPEMAAVCWYAAHQEPPDDYRTRLPQIRSAIESLAHGRTPELPTPPPPGPSSWRRFLGWLVPGARR
jgi:hypothetical protein